MLLCTLLLLAPAVLLFLTTLTAPFTEPNAFQLPGDVLPVVSRIVPDLRASKRAALLHAAHMTTQQHVSAIVIVAAHAEISRFE